MAGKTKRNPRQPSRRFDYRPQLLLLESRDLLSFVTALSYDTGAAPVYGPTSAVVGDFNGDGIPDVAATNGQDVSVLLGNGDGTFQAARHFAAGSFPEAVAVGDFTGNGILDLAVANDTNNGTVSVLLGNGDGTFQAPHTFPAGANVNSVAVGDFNGDGILDLAIADSGNLLQPGGVSVLLGNGDGTFQAGRSVGTSSYPCSVAVGDFNGDGVADLAVAISTTFAGPVSVLLGNGDGSFQTARSFSAGMGPDAVAVGDFNGDGILDLAVADGGGISGSGSGVSVLLGNGNGTFQAAQTYAAGANPRSVAVGDFTGDGLAGLVLANSSGGTVSVLLGNGDGTFQTAQTYAAGAFPDAVAVGDFTGNGILDLAVGNRDGDDVSVLLGNGDGTFRTAQAFAAGSLPAGLAVGDFNGDGTLDLAVADRGANDVSVLLGNGDGTFQPARTYPVGLNPDSAAVGDFNGDGILDLVVANAGDSSHPGSVSVLLGNGDGTFQPAQTFAAGSYPESVGGGTSTATASKTSPSPTAPTRAP